MNPQVFEPSSSEPNADEAPDDGQTPNIDTPDSPSGVSRSDLSAAVHALQNQVSELSTALDQVVPHLVATLKRNQAFDSILERLESAEKRLAARNDAPMAAVLLRTMNEIRRMQHLDRETRSTLVKGVGVSLLQSGYEIITPRVGQPYDPNSSDITAGDLATGEADVVLGIDSYGLACLGEVIVPAKVTVGGVGEFPAPTADATQDAQEET